MLYLLGVNLPDHRIVSYALRSIYGIGPKLSQQICHKLYIHPLCKLSELPESKVTLLSKELNTLTIESDLKRQVANRISRLVRIGSVRGQRHASGKPVRGQSTHTNGVIARKLNRQRLAKAFS